MEQEEILEKLQTLLINKIEDFNENTEGCKDYYRGVINSVQQMIFLLTDYSVSLHFTKSFPVFVDKVILTSNKTIFELKKGDEQNEK